MNKIVHYIGLDVHKDSIAVSIAPQNSTEVRRYGILGATLDAVDVLLKRTTLETPKVLSHTSPAVGPLPSLAGLPWVTAIEKVFPLPAGRGWGGR